MILSGTVVADPSTLVGDGAVVVEGSDIAAVGDRADLVDRYPDHREESYDIVAPGQVGAHVHSVQSLGRGIADDTELLDWLFDYILPMEATLTADEMGVAARLGYLELIESGTTTAIDHLSVAHADRAFEAAGEMGVRGVLGKVLMDQRSPEGLLEDSAGASSVSSSNPSGDRWSISTFPRTPRTPISPAASNARSAWATERWSMAVVVPLSISSR